MTTIVLREGVEKKLSFSRASQRDFICFPIIFHDCAAFARNAILK